MIAIYIQGDRILNIVIIFTHPNQSSFSGAILKSVGENLSPRHNIKVIDLYKDNFDSRLRFDEKHRRRDLANDPSTQSYRDAISWADHLIFIFPIWWGGMPGILKGFIDRVFVSGFAFHYEGIFPIGHLKGKTSWVITTHDTPFLAVPFLPDYGKVLKKFILKICGIKLLKSTSIPNLRSSSIETRQKALNRIAKEARKI